MVEFKTNKNDANDARKLSFFTMPNNHYHDKPWLESVKVKYDLGVLVCLEKKLPIFKIYKDGRKLTPAEACKELQITKSEICFL